MTFRRLHGQPRSTSVRAGGTITAPLFPLDRRLVLGASQNNRIHRDALLAFLRKRHKQLAGLRLQAAQAFAKAEIQRSVSARGFRLVEQPQPRPLQLRAQTVPRLFRRVALRGLPFQGGAQQRCSERPLQKPVEGRIGADFGRDARRYLEQLAGFFSGKLSERQHGIGELAGRRKVARNDDAAVLLSVREYRVELVDRPDIIHYEEEFSVFERMSQCRQAAAARQGELGAQEFLHAVRAPCAFERRAR